MACSEFNWTRLFNHSVSSAPLKVRRFTTTLPSAFTLTTTSPIGAVFSFAAEAFGTLTSSSFSVRAAFHVSRKKSITATAHRPAAPVEYRDDAGACDHVDSYYEGDDVGLANYWRDGQLTVRPRSAPGFARPACRTATKATPRHASKQLPIPRSTFGLFPGKKRRTSSREYR